MWNKVEMEVPTVNSALGTCQRHDKTSAHGEWRPCEKGKISGASKVEIPAEIPFQWSNSSTGVLNEFPLASFHPTPPPAGFPSTTKTHTLQLANLHRLPTSFTCARHGFCCEQPIQRELFELFYSSSHCIAQFHHSWQGRVLLQLVTGVAEEMMKHFVQLDGHMSLPTTNYRTCLVTTQTFLDQLCLHDLTWRRH